MNATTTQTEQTSKLGAALHVAWYVLAAVLCVVVSPLAGLWLVTMTDDETLHKNSHNHPNKCADGGINVQEEIKSGEPERR